MARSELCEQTAAEMAARVRAGEVSPVELVEAHLERIEALNPRLTAFIRVDAEGARERARALERSRAGGLLAGVPVAYKDIYDVAGLPTTAGSRTRLGRVAERDSTAAERWHQAGAICVGKLNTFEFASGTMEVFGDARNPWNLAHSPGGSSSGSGAALAARLVPLATGSDTGGSIRIPASFCGLAGLRPTHGLVSRAGVVPLSWSLDSAGPMARTVEDVALALEVMAGPDPRDATTVDTGALTFVSGLGELPRSPRIGVPRQYFFDDTVASDVRDGVRAALEVFRGLGAELVEIDLPLARHGLAASWAISYSEAFAYHREGFFARPRDYTSAFLHKITGAALLGSEELLVAYRMRERITAELAEVFPAHRLSAIVTPATPYTAFPLGGAPQQDMGRLTRPISLAGLPALSVPCGFDTVGLPIGMQIVGQSFHDRAVLRLGHAYQQATAWHTQLPPMDERVPQPLPGDSVSSDHCDWVLDRARALGISYVEPSDAPGIAASIAPMLGLLAEARHALGEHDLPALRPAPRPSLV